MRAGCAGFCSGATTLVVAGGPGDVDAESRIMSVSLRNLD
jgi:hypothetical protein